MAISNSVSCLTPLLPKRRSTSSTSRNMMNVLMNISRRNSVWEPENNTSDNLSIEKNLSKNTPKGMLVRYKGFFF
ncbi:Uncharacterised protein [Mycobacterium tuberculosis]|nr:Uncharacterised protein [Mycobacterium tuberculosis]